MSLSNDQITALNFKDFYNQIRPYLNGEAHDAFIPIGSIISIMGNEAPLNFLICDGSIYNIADYPQLASYFTVQFESANYFGGDGTTTFAVPDLRGEFLRGTGTNSHTDQGNGANVGTHQDATEQTFIQVDNTGNGNAFVGVSQNISNTWAAAKYDSRPKFTQNRNVYTFNVVKGTDSYGSDTPYTARPTNTSVLYCIAYKNVYADMSGLAEAGDGININNGVVSTDNMPSSDMSEVASPMPSVMSRRFKYSTEEQVIGEWIDGKPLYQKTIDCGALPNNTSKFVEHHISNIDKVVSISAVGINSNGTLPIPYVNTDNLLYQIQFESVTSTDIRFYTKRNFSDTNAYVTIQYTKTTD